HLTAWVDCAGGPAAKSSPDRVMCPAASATWRAARIGRLARGPGRRGRQALPLPGFAPGWPVLAGLRLDSGAGVGEAVGVGEALRMSSAEGLVWREAEFGLAAAAVRQLSDGRASALAIEGEAGIGKTRLV